MSLAGKIQEQLIAIILKISLESKDTEMLFLLFSLS